MDAITSWWNGLPYYLTGSIIRFVRVTFLAALTAGALLLTNTITVDQAIVSVQVAAGGALLAAIDKLRREWGIEQEAKSLESLADPVKE